MFFEMLPNAYLTDRQLEIWALRFKGVSKAEIGRLLGITRQAVYDAENISLEKVELALTHTAQSNMIEPEYIDPIKGVLLGYSPQTKQKVIITFSTKNGIQTWHYQQPDCESCKLVKKCRTRLVDEAVERDVILSEEERQLTPSELANKIFRQLIPSEDFDYES
jgi:predicted DNA-binding protein YlxM (UPF0122 family)